MTTIRHTADDGAITFELSSGHRFTQPALPTGTAASAQAAVFEAALDAVGNLAKATGEVAADDGLSDVGRERKLDAVRQASLLAIARSAANLEVFARGIDERETALLQVPSIDPGHAVAAIEDREIRDWWRALPIDRRAQMMKRMDSEPGHERIEIALLRSPVALADPELQSIRESWNRGRRLNSPAEALAIDSGRAATEWARRGLAQVAGIATGISGWAASRTLREVVLDEGDADRGGYGVFGLSRQDAVQMRQRLADEARR